ncbi:hypothetical protein [uncultured Thomasclavelia sp.]|uniref:hypothetical protein n=1 Tax=uncultured Thomasclavelia sp. TaxID=3025759 RepID=UPI00259470CD|nr:hypothetical protein [uncultured Thomasclavelia sp.]
MNINKFKNYQWVCAVIKLETEEDDDYLFTYDIDKAIEPYSGKLRIEKVVFKSAKDNEINQDFILDMMELNRVAMIRPCSKPLFVYEQLPDFDYWSVLLAQRYIEEFLTTGRMPIKYWVKKEIHSESIN